MNTFVRLLYAAMIAIITVTFIGVAIYSLYPGPKQPDYSSTQTTAEVTAQERVYQTKNKKYERKVTYAVLAVTVLILAWGMYLYEKSEVIGEGVSLGGVATGIYGVITASIADSRPLRFIAVSLLLVGALLVTQRRFREPGSAKNKQR